MPDKVQMRLGGIILTGGRSARMGRAKEALPLDGTTMLARQCRTLAAAAAPVVVVARDAAQALPELPAGVDVAHDAAPGTGPLGGIAAGLAHLRNRYAFTAEDAAFVTGNDLPFVDAQAIRWLAERLAAAPLVMPRALGSLQPLCAVYRLACLAHAEAMLRDGAGSPRALAALPGAVIVEEPDLRALDPELRWLRNVNTAADYDAARAELERR